MAVLLLSRAVPGNSTVVFRTTDFAGDDDVGNRRNIDVKALIGVVAVLLMTAAAPRTVEAIPLSNSVIDAATLCLAFDCGAGVDATDVYSFAPDPDPDGELLSFAAPGLDPSVSGLWLYAYQISQATASTADVTGLRVPFAGLFEDFSFLCEDCGGTEPPTLAEFLADPASITFFVTVIPGSSSTLFGAVSSFAPTMATVSVLSGDDIASALALAPIHPTQVPEPGSLMLLGAGVAAFAVRRWTKKR
jgi:hypothetical protein